MRSRADETLRIRAVTNNDFVNYVFDPTTARTVNSNDRNAIYKALFDEGSQQLLIGNW